MQHRTFTRDFSYDIDEATRRSIPAGWSGEIEDEVAKAADAAGATTRAAKATKAAPPAEEGAPPA